MLVCSQVQEITWKMVTEQCPEKNAPRLRVNLSTKNTYSGKKNPKNEQLSPTLSLYYKNNLL